MHPHAYKPPPRKRPKQINNPPPAALFSVRVMVWRNVITVNLLLLHIFFLLGYFWTISLISATPNSDPKIRQMVSRPYQFCKDFCRRNCKVVLGSLVFWHNFHYQNDALLLGNNVCYICLHFNFCFYWLNFNIWSHILSQFV